MAGYLGSAASSGSPWKDFLKRAQTRGLQVGFSNRGTESGVQAVFNQLASGQGVQGPYSPEVIQSAQQLYNESQNLPATQDAGGYGGGSYDPNYDPNAIAAGRSSLAQKLQAARDAFNGIFQELNNSAVEQRNKVLGDYNTQLDSSNQAYQNQLGQLGSVMAGRGLADSSYLSDAQQQSKNAYDQGVNQLGSARDSNLSSIGQWLAGRQQAYQSQFNNVNSIDPNQYGTVSDLNSAAGQVGSVVDQLGQARAGLKSSQEYKQMLSGLAPIQSTTSADLAKQLQTLVTSSAPRFAKEQIAQGIIRRAQMQDPNAQAYWQDYFQKLLAAPTPGA